MTLAQQGLEPGPIGGHRAAQARGVGVERGQVWGRERRLFDRSEAHGDGAEPDHPQLDQAQRVTARHAGTVDRHDIAHPATAGQARQFLAPEWRLMPSELMDRRQTANDAKPLRARFLREGLGASNECTHSPSREPIPGHEDGSFLVSSTPAQLL
jgi:hypothetical protein